MKVFGAGMLVLGLIFPWPWNIGLILVVWVILVAWLIREGVRR